MPSTPTPPTFTRQLFLDSMTFWFTCSGQVPCNGTAQDVICWMYGWLTTSKGKPPSKAMDKGKHVRKIYLFKSLLLCLTSVRQVLYAKILQKWSFDDDVCSLAQTGAWPKKYFCKTTVIRHEDCKTICNYVHFVQTRDAARKPGYYWDWWHYCAHNRHSVDRNMQASNRYVFWSAASEPQSCQEQGHNPFSRLINIFVQIWSTVWFSVWENLKRYNHAHVLSNLAHTLISGITV